MTHEETTFWERIYSETLAVYDTDAAKRRANAALAARREADAPAKLDGEALLANLKRHLNSAVGGALASRDVIIPFGNWEAVANHLAGEGVRPLEREYDGRKTMQLSVATRYGIRYLVPEAP